MLALTKFREENETGFTLIELLVVILIIGILAAIAIPMFINQRKSAVDASVQSDVRNAATVVDTSLIKSGGSVATSSAIQSAVATSKVGTGTTLASTGDSNGYCITGTNAGGDSAVNGNIVYASLDGGMKTLDDTHICKAGKIIVGTKPAPAAPLAAGTLSWTGTTTFTNPEIGANFEAAISAAYVPGSRTVHFIISKPDTAPVATEDKTQIYVNYGCTDGRFYDSAWNGGGADFVGGKAEFNITNTMGGCDVNKISVVAHTLPYWWGPAQDLNADLT